MKKQLLFIIALLFASTVSWAGTITVGPGGPPTYQYATIQEALPFAVAGDVIIVAAGTFSETVPLVIDKNLTITGAGKTATTVKPADGGLGSSIFKVIAGTLTLSDLTIDGDGYLLTPKIVRRGVRTEGTGSVNANNCKVINIKEGTYEGYAFALTSGINTISNTEMSNIERVGVFVLNTATQATVTGCTYTGKGAGDYTDNAYESNNALLILNNSIATNCKGIASTDLSEAAGLVVWSAEGAPGGEALVSGCTFSNNATGIGVGILTGDISHATVSSSSFLNNTSGNLICNQPGNHATATCNWWGSFEPTVIAAKISGDVTYTPWLVSGIDRDGTAIGFQPLLRSCMGTGGPFLLTISPFGGEVWQRGTTKSITWTDNLTSNVKIQLCNAAGTALSTLKASAPGTSFNWFIPSNLTPGNYRIKLSNANNITLFDLSEVFAVCAGTPGGTITVVNPGTGVDWNRGASHLITWSKTCTENVKIELINSSGAIQMLKSSIAGLSYNWFIPYSQAAGIYTMKISSILDPVNITNSKTFDITLSTGGSVTVDAPLAGADWEQGAIHTIEWTKTFPENVKIELINSSGSVQTLKVSTPGDFFNWYIPYSQLVGAYTMRISSILDPTVKGEKIFDITLNSGGSVTIDAPVIGAHWARGASHLIEWTKTFSENVKIELISSGGSVQTIKTSIAGDSYNWYLPFSQPAGAYTMRISSVLNPSLKGENLFNITLSTGGTVTVSAPVAGADWEQGNVHLIEWIKTFPENVKIELINSGGSVQTLKTSTEGLSFDWYIPYSQPAGGYTMRISSILNPAINGTSNFDITLSAGGTITVTAPNGGEFWGVGASHLITWTKTCTENVKIDLCNASGVYISTLKSVAPGLSYNWYVPWSFTPGSYTIRVSSILDGTTTDISNAPFTIAVFAFNVFPNPGGPVLNVELDNYGNGIYTIELFDRFGTKVKSNSINTESVNHCAFSTSDLPNDVYIMVVTSIDNVRVTKKVLIQN